MQVTRHSEHIMHINICVQALKIKEMYDISRRNRSLDFTANLICHLPLMNSWHHEKANLSNEPE